MIIVAAVMLILFGIDVGWHCHDNQEGGNAHIHRARLHEQAESWDQENLKRNDRGCPTAVFVAPEGNLEQCL